MAEIFRQLFALFDARERRRFIILAFVMVFVALAEVLGVAVVLGLLKVMTDPDLIFSSGPLSWTFETLGFTSVWAFEVFLSLISLAAVVAGQIVKIAGNYAIIRFGTMRGFTISNRLIQAYLGQPYAWFLGRNSAEMEKTVLSEVYQLEGSVLLPGLNLLANAVIAASILGLLFFVDPLITGFAILGIGGAYVGLYLTVRKKLLHYGQEIVKANELRFRLTKEATGGFKEVKLLGLEDAYSRRFLQPAMRFSNAVATSRVLQQVPRFAIEAMAFAVLLMSILLMLYRSNGDLVAAIPVLGTFAFSIMKLLPAMQNFYGSLAAIRGGKPVLENLYNEYTSALENIAQHPPAASSGKHLEFAHAMELQAATYCYPAATKPAIRGLDMVVPANSTVGIVGGTGAGKTTLVDVILGLLTLDEGQLRVDGRPITRANLLDWRKAIGYVPQAIYLTDTSVAENIAFGIEPRDIDLDAVHRAAKVAALHDFVTSELSSGYDTIVGERGVRLSGGQRQRIGIARALYHDPDLLILDEATSALDNVTERAVMDAVHNIGHEKTIIMVAHRLTTVRNCDRIFLLEHGKVGASGTYDELLAKSEAFRRMVYDDREGGANEVA